MKRKPQKKVPKRNLYWETEPLRFPVKRETKPTTGCNIEEMRVMEYADETTLAVRDEITRRTEILADERAKYPPTTVTVGKGKKKRTIPNPDFTPEMREALHEFAFTAEQVRAEIEGQS